MARKPASRASALEQIRKNSLKSGWFRVLSLRSPDTPVRLPPAASLRYLCNSTTARKPTEPKNYPSLIPRAWSSTVKQLQSLRKGKKGRTAIDSVSTSLQRVERGSRRHLPAPGRDKEQSECGQVGRRRQDAVMCLGIAGTTLLSVVIRCKTFGFAAFEVTSVREFGYGEQEKIKRGRAGWLMCGVHRVVSGVTPDKDIRNTVAPMLIRPASRGTHM